MTRSFLTSIVLAALAAMFVSARPVYADAPATRPATDKSVRTLIKMQLTVQAGKPDALTVLIDVNDAPELKPWAEKVANKVFTWYPTIADRLSSDGFKPAREITLKFAKIQAPGQTGGTTIECSIDWVTAHPDDFGMVAHELTHVIQHYKKPGPGWLTEGIADYVRYYVIEPGSARAKFDVNRQSYKNGYQPAAGLLNFVEQKHPGAVARLNAAMREGTYTDALIQEIAGDDWDVLWGQLKESLAK